MCGRREERRVGGDLDLLVDAIDRRAAGLAGPSPFDHFEAMRARALRRQIGPMATEVGDAGEAGSGDGLPGEVRLTEESRQNIERAPEGTRFYCMLTEAGDAHCAAGQGAALSEDQKSRIGGVPIEPPSPGWGGTGHQQLARRVGLAFDEETAAVGVVHGDEGYGISVEKISPCQRDYAFNSAFNLKTNDEGSRTLPESFQRRIRQGLEGALPACERQ